MTRFFRLLFPWGGIKVTEQQRVSLHKHEKMAPGSNLHGNYMETWGEINLEVSFDLPTPFQCRNIAENSKFESFLISWEKSNVKKCN